MTLGAFGMILLLSRAGFEAEELEDFRGLNRRSQWFAFVMLVIVFSLAGIPPAVGFLAKLAVLQAAFEAGYGWLVVFAVLMSVVGAFYYLRLVKLMYMDEPAGEITIAAARRHARAAVGQRARRARARHRSRAAHGPVRAGDHREPVDRAAVKRPPEPDRGFHRDHALLAARLRRRLPQGAPRRGAPARRRASRGASTSSIPARS